MTRRYISLSETLLLKVASMFSCLKSLNTSASVIVLQRPLKTEIEDDFPPMAFSICFTVKLYENEYVCAYLA
jgi:hypothetical protein